jgi:hypothetical protein
MVGCMRLTCNASAVTSVRRRFRPYLLRLENRPIRACRLLSRPSRTSSVQAETREIKDGCKSFYERVNRLLKTQGTNAEACALSLSMALDSKLFNGGFVKFMEELNDELTTDTTYSPQEAWEVVSTVRTKSGASWQKFGASISMRPACHGGSISGVCSRLGKCGNDTWPTTSRTIRRLRKSWVAGCFCTVETPPLKTS